MILAGYSASLTRFRGDLIKSWLSLGHGVTAAAPGRQAEAELGALGVNYVRIPLKRTGLNPATDIIVLASLIRLIWQVKPDYLFLYTVKPVIYGSLAALFYRPVKVYSLITGLGYAFTGGSGRGALRKLVSALYCRALKRNAKVMFQNPDDRALFIEKGLVSGDKTILVNGSGVDVKRYAPAPLPGPPLVFLLIARLLLDKGIAEYAGAAAKVKEKYPQTKFLLLGSFFEYPASVKKEQLERWVKGGTIDYLGTVKDVRPVIAAASVYVLPSYREGTPRSTLEAMAMGRPVVTTDAPGCRETVKEGINGFLVPVKDAQALAEAMEKFILEPGLIEKMGRESRRIAEEKFDVRKVNEAINRAMGLI